MINQQSWMFLYSFDEFRKNIVNNKTVLSMLQLGAHAFEEIGGEVVQTIAFVLKSNNENEIKSVYYRLVDFSNVVEKERKFLSYINNELDDNKFCTPMSNY